MTSKNNFRQRLKSHEIQTKLNQFISSEFTNDINGVNKCVSEFQDIIIETSKKSLKIRKKKIRKKITNVANKKWFDKDCRIKRHQVRKLANQKHRDPINLEVRNAYHAALKTYKEILHLKKATASGNDPNLFWKTLNNATGDLKSNNNSSNSPKPDQWLKHFEKLHSNHKLNNDHKIAFSSMSLIVCRALENRLLPAVKVVMSI